MHSRSIAFLLLSALSSTAACHEGHSEAHEAGTFLVSQPLRKDTELTREYVGQVRAIQHIDDFWRHRPPDQSGSRAP